MIKKLYHIIFLVSVAINLRAQVKIITRSDSLLFIGLENQVKINSEKIHLNKLKLLSNIEGSVKGGKGNYEILCVSPKKDYFLKVMFGKKVVAVKKMKIIKVSDPEVYIASDTLISEGLVSKKHLLRLDSVIIKINVPYFKLSVVRFDFIKISNGITIDSLSNFGSRFNDKIKKILSTVATGDILWFDNFRIGGPDDILVPSIKITVTK